MKSTLLLLLYTLCLSPVVLAGWIPYQSAAIAHFVTPSKGSTWPAECDPLEGGCHFHVRATKALSQGWRIGLFKKRPLWTDKLVYSREWRPEEEAGVKGISLFPAEMGRVVYLDTGVYYLALFRNRRYWFGRRFLVKSELFHVVPNKKMERFLYGHDHGHGNDGYCILIDGKCAAGDHSDSDHRASPAEPQAQADAMFLRPPLPKVDDGDNSNTQNILNLEEQQDDNEDQIEDDEEEEAQTFAAQERPQDELETGEDGDDEKEEEREKDMADDDPEEQDEDILRMLEKDPLDLEEEPRENGRVPSRPSTPESRSPSPAVVHTAVASVSVDEKE